jgi:hypothetical protein
MAFAIDHQAISVAAGTRDFGPVTISNGLTQVTLRLARMTTATPTFWAAGVTVKLDSWCSLDGGATWIQWLGFAAEGGIYVRHDSTEATESTVTSPLPAGTSRQMKFTATVAGGALVSQITVEVV